MSRRNRMERALPTTNRAIGAITVAIVLVGLVLVVTMAGRPERERIAELTGIAVGDPGAELVDAVGALPHRCPADYLDHLRPSFPEGWPSAAVDVALERMAEVTAERWVFPIGDAPPVVCAITDARTEAGVDSAGAVAWLIEVTGRTPLRLPAWLQPAGADVPTAQESQTRVDGN